MPPLKDNPDGLWVVDGEAYDLTQFMVKHPGGFAFLGRSRMRDITVPVNTYHPDPSKLEPILAKYRVRKATPADIDPFLNKVPEFLFPEGFRADKEVPQFDFKNSNRLVREINKRLARPEWKAKIKAANQLYDRVVAVLVVAYFVCQYCGILGHLGVGSFAVLATVLRVCLAGAGHYFLHRKRLGVDAMLSNFFDFSFVGFAMVVWDGHVLLHHVHTNTPADIKRGVFLGIAELPRLLRLPIHTLQQFGHLVSGKLIRGVEIAAGPQARLFLGPDCFTDMILPMFMVRFLFIVESFLFLWHGRWLAWWCQFFLTVWVTTFQIVASHEFEKGPACSAKKPPVTKDWGVYELLNTIDISITGNQWVDCFLTAGLGPHRVHHLVPYQRSGFANIVSEPVVREVCEEQGFVWNPPRNFFSSRIAELFKHYMCAPVMDKDGKAMYAGLWEEHTSWTEIKKCLLYVYYGFQGLGSV